MNRIDQPSPKQAGLIQTILNWIAVTATFLMCSAVLAQGLGSSSTQNTSVAVSLGITTLPLWPSASTVNQDLSGKEPPTLTMFAPQPGNGNGTAVVIAPGGAYLGLASNLEGRQVADWFTARGITAFVLEYRLGPKNPYPTPLRDAQRAIRVVRALDPKYGLSSKRIGMVGFSAGGHLAAAAGTLFDEEMSQAVDSVDKLSDRPDFLVLGYPWLNAMQPNNRKLITYCSLMRTISPADCVAFEKQYTPALHVTSKTPPAFIYSTSDDSVVPISASVDFYSALQAAGVSAELHIFRHGVHGSGLGVGDAALDQWPQLLEQWLRGQGLLEPDATATEAAKNANAAPPRKPGEHLSVESQITDIIGDSSASALVAKICGESFLKTLPDQAKPLSLKTISPYFPELSPEHMQQIAAGLAALPIH